MSIAGRTRTYFVALGRRPYTLLQMSSERYSEQCELNHEFLVDEAANVAAHDRMVASDADLTRYLDMINLPRMPKPAARVPHRAQRNRAKRPETRNALL